MNTYSIIITLLIPLFTLGYIYSDMFWMRKKYKDTPPPITSTKKYYGDRNGRFISQAEILSNARYIINNYKI